MTITNKTPYIIALLILGFSFFLSCSEDQIPEVNTESFICFENDSLLISSQDIDEINLAVLVCAAPHDEEIEVNFEINSTDMTEGVDYSISNTSSTLHYPEGTYNDTITVNLLQPIEDSNTIKIISLQLIDNSIGYTLGYPGIDHNNQTVTLYIVQ